MKVKEYKVAAGDVARIITTTLNCASVRENQVPSGSGVCAEAFCLRETPGGRIGDRVV